MVYSALAIIVDDFCGVQSQIAIDESTNSYVELYPAAISGILDECLFGTDEAIHENVDES